MHSSGGEGGEEGGEGGEGGHGGGEGGGGEALMSPTWYQTCSPRAHRQRLSDGVKADRSQS